MIIALLAKGFLVNPALLTGTAISTILVVFLVRKKKVSFEELYLFISMLICVGWGNILWFMVRTVGHSEMYFAMASFIPQHILIAEMYARRGEVKEGLVRTVIKCICCVMMAISVTLFSFYGHLKVGMITAVYRGMKNLYSVELNQIEDWEKSTCIRRTDVEALEWIRDNTDEDALILCDRAAITGDTAYYCYGIYCERQQYLEGTNMFFQLDNMAKREINERLTLIFSVYNNENGALQDLKEEGVDFIVQTKDITPNFEYNPKKLQLMFSTDTINIYQVK